MVLQQQQQQPATLAIAPPPLVVVGKQVPESTVTTRTAVTAAPIFAAPAQPASVAAAAPVATHLTERDDMPQMLPPEVAAAISQSQRTPMSRWALIGGVAAAGGLALYLFRRTR